MKGEGLPLFSEGTMGDEVSDLPPDMDQPVIEAFGRRVGDVEGRLELRLPLGSRELSDLLAGDTVAEKNGDQDENVLGPAKEALDRRYGVVLSLLPQFGSGVADGPGIGAEVRLDIFVLPLVGLGDLCSVKAHEELESPEQCWCPIHYVQL